MEMMIAGKRGSRLSLEIPFPERIAFQEDIEDSGKDTRFVQSIEPAILSA